MKNSHHVGFAIFLIFYSYFKYVAVPSMMGQTTYILTTSVLVLITAIIPFYAAYFLAKKASPPICYLLASLMPLVFSGIGLAIYFYLFIAPNAPDMGVTQVLPRALLPGLVMGAISLISLFIQKRDWLGTIYENWMVRERFWKWIAGLLPRYIDVIGGDNINFSFMQTLKMQELVARKVEDNDIFHEGASRVRAEMLTTLDEMKELTGIGKPSRCEYLMRLFCLVSIYPEKPN